MKTLEVRRHTMRRKPGAHLSQDGIALARLVGGTAGPFSLVVTSTIPRAIETAIAMARDLPEEEQDALAEMMAFYMRHNDGESLLTPEQVAEVERRIADPNRKTVPFEEAMERLKRQIG